MASARLIANMSYLACQRHKFRVIRYDVLYKRHLEADIEIHASVRNPIPATMITLKR
jgi:hypothetical protein